MCCICKVCLTSEFRGGNGGRSKRLHMWATEMEHAFAVNAPLMSATHEGVKCNGSVSCDVVGIGDLSKFNVI